MTQNSPRRIDHRDFRVAVMGTWNWVGVVAELLRRAGITCQAIPDLPGRRAFINWVCRGHWRQFDVIHHVRGTNWPLAATFAGLGRPVVWHWLGSDVLHFKAISRRGGGWRGAIGRRAVHQWARMHLVDSPELADELAAYGVHAEVVRLLTKAVEAQVEPMPPRPCVLSYWDKGRRSIYQAEVVMKLAGEFPQVPFIIVGDDGSGLAAPKNVRFLGRLPDLADVYSQVSVYLRLVQHDSLSAMVLEALARGRHVVYSKQFPCVETAGNFAEARDALARLLTKRQPNQAGSQYVRQHYSLQEQADKLKRLYSTWFGIG